MSLSNAAETSLLNFLMNGAAWSLPADLHISLHDGDPGETGANEIDTADWTNYAREAVTRNTTNFPTTADDSIDNGVAISFPDAVIPGSTITVTHFGVWDASSAGTFIIAGTLASAKPMTDGDTLNFNAGGLTITAN